MAATKLIYASQALVFLSGRHLHPCKRRKNSVMHKLILLAARPCILVGAYSLGFNNQFSHN